MGVEEYYEFFYGKKVKHMYEEVGSLLSRMIQIQTISPSGNEDRLAQWLKTYLKEQGIDSRLQEVGPGRSNLIVDLGEPEGPLLILDGHLDVVPATGTWTYEPFAGTIADGKVWGRGAADMKGGLAAMIMAACQIVKEKRALKGGLRLLFVADEEYRNLGIRHYFESGGHSLQRKTYAIVGEPTNLAICRGHLGVERYWIRFKGISAHSSQPDSGCNAITLATRMVVSLDKYHGKIHQTKTFVGSPSCSVTMIEGGEKENSIPYGCRILLDRRTIPGETAKMVDAELEALVAETFGEECSRVEVEHFFSLHSAQLPEDAFIIGQCAAIQERLLGKKVVRGFEAGGEQGFFLANGIEAIVCGPGDIKKAHSTDENIGVEELVTACEFYHEVILSILSGRNFIPSRSEVYHGCV